MTTLENDKELNAAQLFAQVEKLEQTAKNIGSTTNKVIKDIDLQLVSVQDVYSSTNEMAASLKETATQSESVATSTEELASSIN